MLLSGADCSGEVRGNPGIGSGVSRVVVWAVTPRLGAGTLVPNQAGRKWLMSSSQEQEEHFDHAAQNRHHKQTTPAVECGEENPSRQQAQHHLCHFAFLLITRWNRLIMLLF